MFPCVEDGKTPACANGYKDATTDPARVRELWWNPNFNIGTCPDSWGALVTDLDIKDDGPGTWARDYADAPKTWTIETPSGGKHLYFRGSAPTSARRLGPGIDTRGRGGYVLLPPSRVGGKAYRAVNNHELAELPSRIASALESGAVATRAALDELDTPGSLGRARTLLADLVRRGDVAVSGRGGNNRTYQVACELLNLGLSGDAARDLLIELWNPACQPPWEAGELASIVEHAERYAQNEAGAWGVPSAADAFGASAAKFLAPRSRRRFLSVAEMAALPDPTWLIKDLIMEGGTCLFVGAWRSYKSFIALDLALSIAAGVPTCCGETPARNGPVIYSALEGISGLGKARRRAWMLGHGLDADADLPFYLGPAPLVSDNADCQAFLEEIESLKATLTSPLALLVIDTLAQSMAGLDETRDAGLFLKLVRELAERLHCAILVLHHFGHDRAKGARGGTVYPAGFDSYIEGEAKGDKRVEVWVRKQKDAEERSAPFTMQGRKIGPALVFYPVERKEHDAAIANGDPLSWQSIGAALEALEARGAEKGVATSILAQQLYPRAENEDPADYKARIGRVEKQLGALAKNKLKAYCEREERGWIWFLPGDGE